MKYLKTFLYLLSIVIIVLLLRKFVVAPVIVSGHSMDPTLSDGEKIITLKYTKNAKRQQIVILDAPDVPEKDYIKRVIGMPGETVEMKSDQLYIDGKKVSEPYLDKYKKQFHEAHPNDPFTEDFTAEVPDGCYFVMGDNRRNSHDSRYIGAIAKSSLEGIAKVIFWPLDKVKVLP